MHFYGGRCKRSKVKSSVRVGYLLNKCSRACCGPTRNLQCAMAEKRENSLWLFNQPVVALGVVCLCSTASNKWISHWQTDVKKKIELCIQKLPLHSQTTTCIKTILDTSGEFHSPLVWNWYIFSELLYGTNTDPLYTRYIVFVWTLHIVCCLLMAYWPCMV